MVLSETFFFMDLSTTAGLVIFLLLLAFAIFLFIIFRVFVPSGLLIILAGLVVLANDINFLISIVIILFGVIVLFMDGNR